MNTMQAKGAIDASSTLPFPRRAKTENCGWPTRIQYLLCTALILEVLKCFALFFAWPLINQPVPRCWNRVVSRDVVSQAMRNQQAVHIEPVNLSSRGVVFPRDRVGMVVCQPYVDLTNQEPFRWRNEAKQRQLEVISKTLDISRANNHGLGKTHFTIFPEYSVCGHDGIGLIDRAVNDGNWPAQTIVVAGIDGLMNDSFRELCAGRNTHIDSLQNGVTYIQPNEWVNCKITWIKAADGSVERWIQPKIEPAGPEQDITYAQMFRGRSVFVFQGKFDDESAFRFASLVCFDWIGSVNGKKIWRWVLDGLQEQATAAEAEYSLSWLFIIQSNKRPSHATFLTEVSQFFHQNQAPRVRRDATCLVFANGAGKPVPGITEGFGQTSLVFSPQALFTKPTCHPTFCNGGPKFRESNLLKDFHDVLFREKGACIHSFAQINPRSVNIGPANRTFALNEPCVFGVDGLHDQRVPDAPVPASVKWVNDELDELQSLSGYHPGAQLAEASEMAHTQNVAALRAGSGAQLDRSVDIATQRPNSQNGERYERVVPDEWGERQKAALEHLLHSLEIISIGSPPPQIDGERAHAEIILNGHRLDFVAVRGDTHEACLEHSEKVLGPPRRQTLLVTYDHHNTEWLKREGSILRVEEPQLGDERKITDPSSGLFHIGFQNLLNIFRHASAAAEVPGGINDALNQ